MSLGYDDTDYEIYDSEKIKYKRKFVKKPLYMNFRVIIVLSVIFATILVMYDYCSTNFDIDLQKEYENYNENDILFGKLNMCQYAKKKYFDTFVQDVLDFKNFYVSLSIFGIFAIIILIIFYYIGFLEKIVILLADNIMKIFNLDIYEILSNTSLYGFFVRLNSCKGYLGKEIIKSII